MHGFARAGGLDWHLRSNMNHGKEQLPAQEGLLKAPFRG